MADICEPQTPADVAGIRVSPDERIHVASLRYFDPDGMFSRAVPRYVGAPLPDRCRATTVFPGIDTDRTILAWCSPTETLLLCDNAALITQLHADVVTHDDGCVIDLTGGAWVLRVNGEAIAALFARMGGQATLPGLGEARRSRLADVPVLALQVQPGEILLIVDRVFVEHLMAWIRVSAADLDIA
jgi:hypothetical protein